MDRVVRANGATRAIGGTGGHRETTGQARVTIVHLGIWLLPSGSIDRSRVSLWSTVVVSSKFVAYSNSAHDSGGGWRPALAASRQLGWEAVHMWAHSHNKLGNQVPQSHWQEYRSHVRHKQT